jgi:hypothetical protein
MAVGVSRRGLGEDLISWLMGAGAWNTCDVKFLEEGKQGEETLERFLFAVILTFFCIICTHACAIESRYCRLGRLAKLIDCNTHITDL